MEKKVKIVENKIREIAESLAAVERERESRYLDTRFAPKSHVETTGLFGVAGKNSYIGIREKCFNNLNFRNRKNARSKKNEKELVRNRGEPP